MVEIVFQSVFQLEIHQNNIFIFIFDIIMLKRSKNIKQKYFKTKNK